MDDAGRVLDVCDIGDDSYGYAYLSTLLAERASGPYSVAIAADSDQHLTTRLLITAGWTVAVVETDATDDFADRFADPLTDEVSSVPSQRRALGLARALQAGAISAGLLPAAPELTELRPVLAALNALANGRQGAAVALREVLRELYPAALRAYADPADPVALAVIEALPEPGTLSASSGRGRDTLDAVTARLTGAGVGDQASITEAITALRVAVAETPRRGGVSRALTATVAETVRQAVAAVRACDTATSVLVAALADRAVEPSRAITPHQSAAPATRAPLPTRLPNQRPATAAKPLAPVTAATLRPQSGPPATAQPVPTSPAPRAHPAPPQPAPAPLPAAPAPPAPQPAAALYAAAPSQPYAAAPSQPYAAAAPAAAPPPSQVPQQAPAPDMAPAPPAAPSPPAPPRAAPAPQPAPVAALQAPAPQAPAQRAPAPQAPAPQAPAPQAPAAASPQPYPHPMSYSPAGGYSAPPAPGPQVPVPAVAPQSLATTPAGPGAQQPVAPSAPTQASSLASDNGFASPPPAAEPAGGYLANRPVSTPPPPPPGITPIQEPRASGRRARSDPGRPADVQVPVPLQRPALNQPPPGSRSAWPTSPPADDWATPFPSQTGAAPSEPRYTGGSSNGGASNGSGTRGADHESSYGGSSRSDSSRSDSWAPRNGGGVTPPWRADDLHPPEPPMLRLVEPTLPEELRDELGLGSGSQSELPSLRLIQSGGGVPRSAPPVSADDDDNLLIFTQTRSAWFDQEPDNSAWQSAMDFGWQAAEQAAEPTVGDRTGAGLPRRVPHANLVPGAPPRPEDRSLRVVRDPASIAAHTSGYFSGWRRGQEVGGFPVGSRPRRAAGAWEFHRDDDRLSG